MTRDTVVDWWFRNRETGEITIGQPPNPPVKVAMVAFGLRVILRPPGLLGTALGAVGTGAVVYWAGDEVLRGVNPYRRLLGATTLAGVAAVLKRRAH
jgi:tetrahydromethanopterin S-methyltransferase subunit D